MGALNPMSWLTKHRPQPALVSPDEGAVLPHLGRVPVLDTRHGWVHDRAASVAGRVVLHQIWTFGCHNCTNTLPAMRAIWERYEPDGLVMVGIHTPEFPREADPAAVAAAVEQLDVRWPVLLDPEWINWTAFANRYWPHALSLVESHVASTMVPGSESSAGAAQSASAVGKGVGDV